MICLDADLFIKNDVSFGILMRLVIDVDNVIGLEKIYYSRAQLTTTSNTKDILHNYNYKSNENIKILKNIYDYCLF